MSELSDQVLDQVDLFLPKRLVTERHSRNWKDRNCQVQRCSVARGGCWSWCVLQGQGCRSTRRTALWRTCTWLRDDPHRN